jgi:hypothetical protein
MIALLGPETLYQVKDSGVTFQGSRMQFDFAQEVPDTPKPMLGVFQRHPAHRAVHLVTLIQ